MLASLSQSAQAPSGGTLAAFLPSLLPNFLQRTFSGYDERLPEQPEQPQPQPEQPQPQPEQPQQQEQAASRKRSASLSALDEVDEDDGDENEDDQQQRTSIE